MELIKVVLSSVVKMMSYQLTFGEYSFSLLSVFIAIIILSIVFYFIGKIFG